MHTKNWNIYLMIFTHFESIARLTFHLSSVVTIARSSSSWMRRLRRDLPERRAAASRYEGNLEEAYFNSLMEESDASDDDFMPFSREDWKQVRTS